MACGQAEGLQDGKRIVNSNDSSKKVVRTSACAAATVQAIPEVHISYRTQQVEAASCLPASCGKDVASSNGWYCCVLVIIVGE